MESALSITFLKQSSSAYDMAELSRFSLSPYFFILNQINKLVDILSAPHHFFLEVGKHSALLKSLDRILEEKPDFSLCLTSESAYHANVAQCISANLNSRFGLLDFKSINIGTCLQEAIINAVVHGNLEIDSSFKTSETMDMHYLQIERLLKTPSFKYRRVTVSAWNYEKSLKISISDQGRGIVIPQKKINDSLLPHGRGFSLMRELADEIWIGDDRRTIFMTFNY